MGFTPGFPRRWVNIRSALTDIQALAAIIFGMHRIDLKIDPALRELTR
jgi:hypothetical protein